MPSPMAAFSPPLHVAEFTAPFTSVTSLRTRTPRRRFTTATSTRCARQRDEAVPATKDVEEKGEKALNINGAHINPDADIDINIGDTEAEECAYFGEEDANFQPLLSNAGVLGMRNFRVEFPALISELLRAIRLLPPLDDIPPKILGLQLSNAGVAAREAKRVDVIPVWPVVRASYTSICVLLDVLFADRPIERFWVLETVARLPYLAYSTCLHFFGTLGWYRSNALMTLHRSEDLNENFHLSIMEALGGDQKWADRFIAFHASLIYFWILAGLFFVSPKQSYGFSLLLETHAVDTYEQFISENEEALRKLPVPKVANTYFEDYLFYFQEMQIPTPTRNRPQLDSLFDVFKNILADEKEHSAAMEACAKYVETGEPVVFNGKKAESRSRNLKMKERRQQFWKEWSKESNNEDSSANIEKNAVKEQE